jgi:NAD(P)-dependent dehydrogenase (short-subunit alcohol dehydrogenase family)
MRTVSELSNLNGRVALITGAAGGLGHVFANTLGELGSSLILVDLPETALKSVTKSVSSTWGLSAESIFCDLEKDEQRSQLIRYVTMKYGRLDILVNNAALVGSSDLAGWSVPFERQSIETWKRALEVNLTAVFSLTQGLFPIMKNVSSASVVNIASIYGLYGPDWRLYEATQMGNPAAYAATKGGLIQFTRWLATTLAPHIRVNAISPGGIVRDQPESFQRKYIDRTPMARMATNEDFKGAITYLATDLSAYVTGQVLEVSGGWGVW